MARRPRITLPEVPLHLIQRGNNRQACFFVDEDYSCYLDCLAEQAGKQDLGTKGRELSPPGACPAA
jgi:putative transposase